MIQRFENDVAKNYDLKIGSKIQIDDQVYHVKYLGELVDVRFGASMCMIGSMFAGHAETPGEIIEQDGKKYKTYFGSASQYLKIGSKIQIDDQVYHVKYLGELVESNLTTIGHTVLNFKPVPEKEHLQENVLYLEPHTIPAQHSYIIPHFYVEK